MPIDWLIETAHAAGTSVYAMIQTRYHTRHERGWATPAMMRAAAANHWTRGADGMYTWALQWPLGDAGRRILSELGDPELAKEGDKRYLVNKHLEVAEKVGYQTLLPLEIPASDRSRHRIPFTIADDIQAAPERIRRVRLKINITDLVSADQLRISLNGRSLAQETCLRDYSSRTTPYWGQWLEFHLQDVRPRKGRNLLEIVLDQRAEGLVSPLRVQDVEIIVEYGSYPSALNYSA